MPDSNTSPPRAPASDWPSDGLEAQPACPVCATADRQLAHPALVDGIFFCAPGRWQMFRCQGCGCGYLDPRPTPATIGLAYASYYTHSTTPEPRWLSDASFLGRRLPSWRNGYLNRRFRHLRRQPSSALGGRLAPLFPYARDFAERDVRHLPPPGAEARLLDIGCGDGNFLRIAEAIGYRAEGLEFDPQATAAACAQGLTVHQGGLPDTGLPGGTYDAVTLSQVIEHVHDPRHALAECLRLLKPGGTLWVATPNMDAQGHARFGPHWRGLEPPRHLVLFTADALLRACTEAGFRNLSLKPIGPVSAWFLDASNRIRTGTAHRTGTPPLLTERLAAIWMDWRAFRDPRRGEELIVVGNRPLA
ncbi:class I SAM-dependent methyltransferase [Methylotetracoccus oryzae]|uniref:class I SAM-dependent methyltransferase n=1 Tax=Methylotetracoccus oryzae TaxID=1919059 RepID=UPI00111989A4|nr:class I SAM-dependent methyltransferase [Methylotetracoccus oryzae]